MIIFKGKYCELKFHTSLLFRRTIYQDKTGLEIWRHNIGECKMDHLFAMDIICYVGLLGGAPTSICGFVRV